MSYEYVNPDYHGCTDDDMKLMFEVFQVFYDFDAQENDVM